MELPQHPAPVDLQFVHSYLVFQILSYQEETAGKIRA